MVKILQATSRGQVTLPKKWRESFNTTYYKAEIIGTKLVIVPLAEEKSFEEKLQNAWKEYKDGKFISHEDLKKKYGL